MEREILDVGCWMLDDEEGLTAKSPRSPRGDGEILDVG
jgi:hypothetical protein